MGIDKQKLKSEIRKSVLALIFCFFVYVLSYGLNSFFGGYWLAIERDSRDGFWEKMAVMWQPRIGHAAIGDVDFIGALYLPMILLDRNFFHPRIYWCNRNYYQEISSLKISQIHPYWRDEFLKKVEATAVEDEKNKILRCIINYTGSSKSREIVGIKMRRAFAELLKISAPSGFAENTNKDSEGYFITSNYVYWAGTFLLKTNQGVTLDFPIQNLKGSPGSIIFYYQRTDNAANSKNFCFVELK